MSRFEAMQYAFGVFFALTLAFNAAYSLLVLPRIRSSGRHIGGDAAINIFQYRYVKEYWDLLSGDERRKWYNLAIKHSFLLAGTAWVIFVGLLFTL